MAEAEAEENTTQNTNELKESNQNFLVYSAFYLAYLGEIKGDEGEIKKVEETIEKLKGELELGKGGLKDLVNKFSEKVNNILGINN